MVFNRPGDHLASTSNPAPGSRRPARMLRGNHPALVAAGHRCPVRAGGADRRTPPTQRGRPGGAVPRPPINPTAAAGTTTARNPPGTVVRPSCGPTPGRSGTAAAADPTWRGELRGRQTPPWADGRPDPLDALPVITLTPLTPLTYAAVLLLPLPQPPPVTPGRHHRR